MSTEIATRQSEQLPEVTEKALLHGDLGALSVENRLGFYHARCRAAGLNPLCRPFAFVKMKGGATVLYALKECAEQLNALYGISHTLSGTLHDEKGGVIEVMVQATAQDGRTTVDVGAVSVMGLKGDDLANARMKAFTKAKRRSTLSLCGLGDMPDETELETMQVAARCNDNGTPIPIDNGTGHGSGKYSSDEQSQSYRESIEGYVIRRNSEWLDRNTSADGIVADGITDLCNLWQADGHLAKWCEANGMLAAGSTPEGGIKNAQKFRLSSIPWHRSERERNAMKRELRRYIDDIERQQTERIELAKTTTEPVEADPELASDEWEEGRE